MMSPRSLGNRLEAATFNDTLRAFRSQLGLAPVKEGDHLEAMAAAVLRATLWALSAAGLRPVHMLRLLGRARNLWTLQASPAPQHGSTPSGENGILEDVLEQLGGLGDFAKLGGGAWLPAPLRCVPLPAAGRFLVAGGVPTHLLPSSAVQAMEHTGVARILTVDPAECGLPPFRQDLWQWCGAIPESARDWALSLLSSSCIAPVDVSDQEFECYWPLKPGSGGLQYCRWIQQWAQLRDDRYLVRTRSHVWRHYVGQIRGGRLDGLASLPPGEGVVRRLMYGLDAAHGAAVRVQTWAVGDCRWFRLRNELPSAELRLLTALGRFHPSEDGQYYPRLWEVPMQYVAQVQAVFRLLGVGLEELPRRE